MKKLKNILIAMVSVLVFTSCINDLNTLPLNENDATSETAYKDEASYLSGLTYIYGYWALVSQNDAGSSDIAVSDAGESELTRMYMVLNELCTDSFKIIWGNEYIKPIQYHTWSSANNSGIIAVYTRCMKGITLANEYLIQTAPEKLQERGHVAFASTVDQYRDEARFNRALFYYILLDLYGNPPFAMPENIGGDIPKQIKRADLYAWLETELLALAGSESFLPEKGTYPQAGKASANAVLTRLYLNAEVYTGTAQWQKAKDAAAKVIASGYSLHQNYEELFMQDNTESGAAAKEFIVGVSYDKDQTQTWGGTSHLVSASLSEAANSAIAQELGVSGGAKLNPENWNGYHVADDYVAKFQLNGVEWGATSGFGYDRANSDKRAFFYNIGSTKEFDNTTTDSGWKCWKFSGRKSDNSVIADESHTNYKFSSIDFPIIRLAEMYMAYAEADAQMNGGVITDATAIEYIRQIRERAGIGMPNANELTLDWILEERAREFMWEGQRRTDLIRHGKFLSMDYPWTLKGGVMDGKVALPEYRTIYPILTSDLNANPNLEQNPGY